MKIDATRQLLIGALAALALAAPLHAADPKGEQLYKKLCASCHGVNGEGAKAFPMPLVGTKSIPQLAAQVAKTMPEDNPGSLSAGDASVIAAHMHAAFYSPEARERNKPPRVELARLTVSQYRNALSDLIASFRVSPKADERRGLKGEYFDARNFNLKSKALERIDPEVAFDFKTESPAEKINAAQFSIRWEGSVTPLETGDYEFIVRTDHATRLWVNDNAKPLIDAWVKSGTDTEFKGNVFLLGGRSYPIRLEFTKAKQGVDDSKKMKDQPPPVKTSIYLLWKQPKLAAEVIPARALSPIKTPELFAPATPFPPDDRSLGWERATTVSKAWDQATTDAALEAATYIVAKANELAGVKDGQPDRDARMRDFCRKLVERAFRQPLSEEQKKLYVDRQFEAAKDTDLAVKRVALLALKSPRFLYREVAGGSASHDTACRLSFALWDAPPDAELIKAAAEGKLATRDQLVKQAERMLTDPRAKAKLREFFHSWLKTDHAGDIAKDPKRFPGFDEAIVSDLRTSLDLLIDEIVWSSASDFRRFFLEDQVYLNARLAKFYGVAPPAGDGFQKSKLNPEQRAGALTHPFLMAAFAYTGTSSPIHRGVFLARGVLGLSMRPPPDAFSPLDEKLHPNLTTRERVALQTKPAACVSCHGVINPLGFTLESFDAVGRYRDKENGKSIDVTGSYQTRAGDTVTFKGIRDLAKFLAGSDEVQAAFAEQMFHHLVKQPVRAFGANKQAELTKAFKDGNFSIKKLAVEIAVAGAKPPGSASGSR
jgi:cytochrome c553